MAKSKLKWGEVKAWDVVEGDVVANRFVVASVFRGPVDVSVLGLVDVTLPEGKVLIVDDGGSESILAMADDGLVVGREKQPTKRSTTGAQSWIDRHCHQMTFDFSSK